MEPESAMNVILMGWAIIGLMSCLINLGIFALNLKLYTEYFKDKKISNRLKR